jgi:hypothetical protein
MSSYFMLECYGPDEERRASIDTAGEADALNWILAKKFSQPVPVPIRITLNANNGLMMPMFNRGILVLSDELLAALAEAGIDNLDCYEAELFNPATGKRFTNYKAVNIIGAVAAADLAKSECQVHGEPQFDVDFDSLVLDEAKTHGLLMFRLAECVTGIVVHESVKRCVERRGIRYLDWVLPEEWIG